MQQQKLAGCLDSELSVLFAQASELKQSAVGMYRDLHQIPQIGLEQHHTSAKVRQFLSNLEGLEIQAPLPDLPTAVIATVSVPNAEESILLRCQLDALPLKQASQLPYSSTNGLHHACAHDAHMTILLLAAKIIVANREKLRKRITFCFQPGEEGKRGAYKLFGCYPSLLESIDNCYALHADNSLKVGQIKLRKGAVSALSNRFTINIKGKSAHCMMPHVGVDANYIGCTLVSQLYTIPSLTVPTLEGSTLVVYKVEGGSNTATVSDSFKIMASVRTFSTKSYEELKEKIGKVLCYAVCYRPVVNDEKVVKVIQKKLEKIKQFQVLEGQRVFAGEDFCEFSERKPSCYIRIGSALADSRDENGESIYPFHSALHRIDEDVLQVGIKVWLAVVFG